MSIEFSQMYQRGDFLRDLFSGVLQGEPHTDDTGIASVEAAYSRAKRLFSRGFLCAETLIFEIRL